MPDVAITHPGGNTVFCSGGSVNLAAATGIGFTYQWFRGGLAVAGATNATYTASLSGGYRVTVTNSATTCMGMTAADTVVTVVSSPLVVPVSSDRFCHGSGTLLSTSVSSVGSAVGYQWLLNGVNIPGANGSTYNAAVAGNYSCVIAVPGSCTVTTATMPIIENPLPNPLVTFDGTTFHTQSYFVSYQWYKTL